MAKQISCPKCKHDFCLKCLSETWKLPIGTGVYRPLDKKVRGEWTDVRAFVAEEQLACCDCSTVSLAKHWPVKNVPKPKDESHKRQMYFWK